MVLLGMGKKLMVVMVVVVMVVVVIVVVMVVEVVVLSSKGKIHIHYNLFPSHKPGGKKY